MQKIIAKGNTIGINLNTLFIAVLVGVIKYEGSRLTAKMDQIDAIAFTQRVYVPKVDALENEMGKVKDRVQAVEGRQTAQDDKIERLRLTR